MFSETLYGAGKAWKWDHKTVFSVLSWLTFAVLLVGRARFGWRGHQGACACCTSGSGLLLLAYVGSRFVMEVVLGRSREIPLVLLVVLVGVWLWRSNRRSERVERNERAAQRSTPASKTRRTW